MPRFKFTGFAADAPVALTLTQGGDTASGAVAAWARAPGEISIAARTQPVPVAPAPVWLEAVDPAGFTWDNDPGIEGYVPAHHEITYVWTVRGNPLADYTAPRNLLPGWKNANVAYGPKVAFFLTDPGDYVIDLWCVKTIGEGAGTVAVAAFPVTVQKADDVFPGTRTVCFSRDGDFTGAPAGAQLLGANGQSRNVLTDTIRNSDDPIRLLFRGGESYGDFAPWEWRLRDGQLQQMGSYGTGRATIEVGTVTAFRLDFDYRPDQLTIADLDFQGGYDPAQEAGTFSKGFTLGHAGGALTGIWNCNFENVETVDLRRNATSSTIMGNCTVSGWRDYGHLFDTASGSDDIALIGNSYTQALDALNGTGPKDEMPNLLHGPLRVSSCNALYIGACNFLSRNGWGGSSYNLGEGSDQPCIRLHWNGERGFFSNLDRVSCEGGGGAITYNSGGGGNPVSYPATHIIDKMLAVGTVRGGHNFGVEAGGFTFRNIISVVPDAAWASAPGYAMGDNVDNSHPDSFNAPNWVYNNSLIVLKTGGSMSVAEPDFAPSDMNFADVTIENNLVAGPNLDTAVLPQGAVDTATPIPGWTGLYAGTRFNFLPQEGTLGSAVAPGQSFTLPYAAITSDTYLGDGTAPTDQAYWQANAGVLHHLGINGTLYSSDQGDFSVDFDASGVRLTNTGSNTWGGDYTLRLSRPSQIPPMDTSRAQVESLPLPYPQGGSQVLDTDAGARAYDDVLMRVRPRAEIETDHKAQPVADSGNTKGALLRA